MKKNFLVTTGLVDTWEFNENNYLLQYSHQKVNQLDGPGNYSTVESLLVGAMNPRF